jgi:hypothetical protein
MPQTVTGTEQTPAAQATEVVYVGEWTPLGRAVVIEQGEELQPLQLAESARIRGYAWGRTGTGPREVARAMLLDATDNPMLAERLCRPLTWEVVAHLPVDGFRLTRGEIEAWIAEHA